MFGNGERPLVEVAHRLAMGEPISEIRDVRNTCLLYTSPSPRDPKTSRMPSSA